MSVEFEKSQRHAQLVWFDPGATTGIVALSIRPRWLAGAGDPTWAGLGRMITTSWFGQVGRNPRVVVDGKAKAPGGRVVQVGRARAVHSERPATAVEEREMIRQCEDLLDLWLDAAWGYEDFVPRLGMPVGSDYLSPVRVFSALSYIETQHGERAREPFVQSASMAKTTASDERLKAARLYRPGLPHATDAARHAATFLRRCRQDEDLRAMAWPRLFGPRKRAMKTAESA